jgi:hypothetical protein
MAFRVATNPIRSSEVKTDGLAQVQFDGRRASADSARNVLSGQQLISEIPFSFSLFAAL